MNIIPKVKRIIRDIIRDIWLSLVIDDGLESLRQPEIQPPRFCGPSMYEDIRVRFELPERN